MQCMEKRAYKKARCTSNALGRLTRSGTSQSVFALQMVLSSTKRGSLPSAETIFSLPAAVPSRQCFATSLMVPWNGMTHPACISLRRSCCRSEGFHPSRHLGGFAGVAAPES